MALEPQQGGQNLPVDPTQEPKLNVPPQPYQPAATPQPVAPVRPAEPLKPFTAPQTPVQPVAEPSNNGFADRVAAANAPTFDTEEPVFTPGGSELDTPVDELITAHRRRSRAIWILSAAAIIIVFILIGFYLMRPKTEGEPIVTEETPVVTEEVTPVVTEPTHISAFAIAPASTIAVTLTEAPVRGEIVAALTKEGQRAGLGLTEITFADAQKAPVDSAAFLSALIPSLTVSAAQVFESDFTAFIYKDASGFWPGYVFTHKTTATEADKLAWAAALEKASAGEFFVTETGLFKGWKTGTVGAITDRYNPGSVSAASLGYLNHNGVTLIATSFDGMKQAVKLLGF